jgi:RNA polymerase sigma factor for flagellar operon FliA
MPARKTPPQFAQYKKIRPGTPKEAELIEQYLPFVKNVVGRLALSLPSHVDLDDLYSAGLVG